MAKLSAALRETEPVGDRQGSRGAGAQGRLALLSSHFAAHLPPSTWQSILWREWRNSEDEAYARYLFKRIANEPVGPKVRLILIGLGLVFGLMAGIGLTVLLSFPSPVLAWSGGIIGGLGGYLGGGKISMRRWLAWLTPNSILSYVARPHKLVLVFCLLLFLLIFPALWGIAVFFGLVSGLLLGLVLGLLAWPVLGLVGLLFFQGQVLGPTDLLLSWAGAGVGLGLGIMLGGQSSHQREYSFRHICFWWASPPLPHEVVAALQQAGQTRSGLAASWQKLLVQVNDEQVPQFTPETYIDMLTRAGWQDRFIARYALVMLGGEAIPALQAEARDKSSPLYQTALILLKRIEQETIFRLGEQMPRPLCTRCMVHCQEYLVPVSPDTMFTYYGCRVCRQSRDVVNGELVVAVLDSDMDEAWTTPDSGQVRVNWLRRRAVFDFDRVEIINAGDEEVERFAVQVGNDTDSIRQPRYKQLPCRIGSGCELSPNTLRILQRTFGQLIM